MKNTLTFLLLSAVTSFAASSVEYLPGGATITSGTTGTWTLTVPSAQDITLTTSGGGLVRGNYTGTLTSPTTTGTSLGNWTRSGTTTGGAWTSGTMVGLNTYTGTLSGVGASTAVTAMSFTSTGGSTFNEVYINSNGSVTFPTLRFGVSGTLAGFYRPINAEVAAAINGTQQWGWDVTGFYFGGTGSRYRIATTGTGVATFPANTSGTIDILGLSYAVTAAGTAYTLTASYANVDFGTTDPSITISTAGNYYLYVNASTAFNGATFAGVQSVSAKLRRTNNTAADIGTARSQPLPVITALTGAGPSIMIGPFPYTATAGDVVTVQGILSATPSAGSVTVDACEITAIPR